MNVEALPPLLFNYHNLVGEAITTDDPGARRFFAEECQSHRVEGELPHGLPQVELNFHPLSGKIPDGFARASHKVLARWAYQVEAQPERVAIRAYGNPLSVSLIHHMLVHHSLRYLVSFRDTMMLHAGAVVYRGRSLILTGHGGVGKTTLTSLLLAQGGPEWSVHADDYVFLTAAGESLAYLTRAHIYRSLLNPIPELKKVLTRAERLRLEAFWRMRTLAGIKLPVRIPLARLWPGRPVAVKAIPAALVVLQRGEVSQPVLRQIPLEQAPINDLLEMNFGEARNFLDLTMRSLSAPGWIAMVEQWRHNEQAVLQQVVQRVPVYSLTIPQLAAQFDNSALFASLASLATQPARAQAAV
jgi:hypothetical protein